MKKLGRAFNHLEDLVFFYGSAGADEVMHHFNEILQDASDIRLKWDGQTQIYWGREQVNGPLILASHNSWARMVKSTSSSEMYDFIVNQSGKVTSNDALEERKRFALQFSKLYSLFDAATPTDFVGFVYADILYMSKPPIYGSEYVFKPNNTEYRVEVSSILGKRIATSSVMISGHAFFTEFGQGDASQIPKKTFDEFNSSEIIVNNPYYTPLSLVLNLTELSELELTIKTSKEIIDNLLAPITGVSVYNELFHKYTNYKVKSKSLSTLGEDVMSWLNNAKISAPQRNKIVERLDKYPGSVEILFNIVKYIIRLKNSIIDQLDTNTSEFRIINSEGWVRYATDNKLYGNVKLVPRHRWTPVQYKGHQEVGVCFGRFNPPHAGHKLAWEVAATYNTYYIGTNANTHNSKNPLPYSIKREIMVGLMPELQNHIVAEHNIFTLATRIYNEVGSNIVLNICTDEEWIVPSLLKYNGIAEQHGYFNFKDVKLQPVERISSATSVRNAVKTNDRELFSLVAGISADQKFNVNNSTINFFDIVKGCLDSS